MSLCKRFFLSLLFANGTQRRRDHLQKVQDLLFSSLGIEYQPRKAMVESESKQGQFILFLKLNIPLPQTPLGFQVCTGSPDLHPRALAGLWRALPPPVEDIAQRPHAIKGVLCETFRVKSDFHALGLSLMKSFHVCLVGQWFIFI